jgi:hypothetical protein
MLFDGAAVATAVDVAQDSQAPDIFSSAINASSSSFAESSTSATDTPIEIDPNYISSSLSGAVDTRLALATPAPNNRNELVVVDGSLSNLQTLIDDIARIDPDRTILVLDPSINETAQLSNYLEQHTASFDAIHVLSHGGEGWISLGDQTLHLSTPEQNAQFWDSIKNSLTDSGDVLLYGCNVANNAAGQTIITELANYTSADIAASTDITGQTGDWVLETTSGSIETTSITAAEWRGELGNYDARPVIANITVNEGDGTNYALFVVKGNTGASVTLTLAPGTAAGAVTAATATTDYANSMEYWNGTSWTVYTAATVILPNDELLVRVQILKDADAISTDTFKLTATYTAATGGTGAVNGGASIAAIATIVENGTGKNFTSIAPISVNENSPYAVFTIDKAYGQQVKLALVATNFIASNATDNATIGADASINDVNTTLQYWNGGVWVDYVAGSTVTAPKGIEFLVRVAINDQVAYEGPETFTLKVSDASDITLGYGVATVMDNGTGSIFTGDATVTDASAAYAAALANPNATAAEKQAALNFWRETNVTKSQFITAGNKGAFYKSESGEYYVTGDQATLTGSGITTPVLVKPSNGYNYTGTIIDVAVASTNNNQYLLLTTSGLYTWGYPYLAQPNTYGANDYSFKQIIPPVASGFIPADVKSMTASNAGIMFLMKDGTVRSVTTSDSTSGHPGALDFSRVVIDALGTPLTGITDLQFATNNNGTTAFAYSASSGKFYTWGSVPHLGGGVGSTALTRATEMAPLPDSGISVVQIGVSAKTYYVLGSNGKVYACGANANGSAGQNSTSAVLSWTAMRDTTGVSGTSLTGVQFLSASNGTDNSNNAIYDAVSLILRDGSVLVVGDSNNNRNGLASDALIPTAPPASSAIANQQVYTIEMGGNFSAAMLYGTADTLLSTGAQSGAIGNGGTTSLSTYTTTTFIGDLVDVPMTSLTAINPAISQLADHIGITVNDIIVKEAANTYAVFVLEIASAQNIQMTLGAGTVNPATATSDYTANLSYWNGSAWTTPTASVNLAVTAGQRLHVRVPVLVTAGAEANETFTLNIADAEGSFMKSATATIVEDNTGTTYAGTASNVTVNNVTVNEASPYAVFKITGVANQKVTLSLAGGTASSSEYGAALEYYNGTSWVSYTANSFAAIPSASTTLLVRTLITNDNLLDDGETFRLIVANEAGVTTIGIATIKDDGSGNLFSIANNTGDTDSPTGVGDLPASKDNDQNRPLNINDVAVNERSAYAVFSVSGAANQVLSSLSLIAGTSNSASGSGADYGTGTGTGLEYWNGTSWTSYSTGNISIDATGVMLVRTPIINDGSVDNNETFRLSAEAVNGQTAIGTATIKDDSSGTIFTTTASIDGVTSATSSAPVTAQTVTSPTTSVVLAANAADLPNEDRLLSITSITVNEGSPYAIFKVTGETDQYTRLSLASVSATVGTDTETALQYYDGTAWQNYTTDSFIKIASTGLLVRVAIKNDTGASVGEPGETFKLIAQNTNGTSNSVGGIATIMDDGTGGWFTATNSTGAFDTPGTLDKDFGITSVIVNEGSPYAVFTVNGGISGTTTITGISSLALIVGTASLSDYGAIQYFDGTTWVTYTNQSPSLVSGPVFVRVGITNDILNEGSESFQLRVGPSHGSTNIFGTATIKDDGTGTLFTSGNPSGGVPATATMPTPFNGVVAAASATLLPNDDRPLSVNTFTVNEGSPYAVFIVTGVTGQFVKLATSNGTATSADYGPGLEFYDGAAWQTYGTGDFVQIPAGTSGTGNTLLVRTAILNDAAWDRDETFNLIASTTGNINTTGVATISDSAAGGLFSINNTTGTPDAVNSQNDLPEALDDDRNQPLSTNDISVNEGSPFAVFKFTGTPSQVVTSLTFNGNNTDTAAGSSEDYGLLSDSGIEWWNGSQWISHDVTAATLDSNGVLLLRVVITNDTTVDNNETFTLTVVDRTYSATATATIKDDGSGTLFTAGNPTGSNATITTPPTPVAGVVLAASAGNLPNDDRTLSVNSFSINEGSPQAVFTVTGATGQFVKLALASGTATVGTDTGAALQYLSGSTWTNYTADSFVQMASTTLLVRTTIFNDTFADDDETFTLTATNTGTSSAIGTATIKDDGTGILFGGTNITGTADAPGVSGAPTGPLNNDQTLVIGAISVNEGSSHAVFTITGGANKQVTNLVLSSSGVAPAASGGVDYGASSGDSLEYWNAPANLWVGYTGGNVTLDSSGRLFVRTAINNDSSLDNNETFSLAATNSLGTVTTVIATIKDDGSGTLFTSGNPVGTAPATLTAPTPASSVVAAANSANILNDDRAISVSSITVNEGSQRAIFTVTASSGMLVKLAVASGTATANSDYNPSLQYLIGSTWNNYTTGDYVQTPVSGTLLVRVAITNDSSDEPATGETFTLTVTNSGGINATGTATIFDNGKGSLFSTTNTTGAPDTLAANGLTALDDDRSIKISIADVTVNEGNISSKFVILTLEGIPSDSFKLALGNTSSTADIDASLTTDIVPVIQYWNGSWINYVADSFIQFPSNTGLLLVRVEIVNDSQADNNETFTLIASNNTTASVSGTVTIKDDGTGNLFTPSGFNTSTNNGVVSYSGAYCRRDIR